MSESEQIISRGQGDRVVKVYRRRERGAIVYACWNLTDDGTPIGARYEYVVEAVGGWTIREQIAADPDGFQTATEQFVDRIWAPPVCEVCRAAIASAIVDDAVVAGFEVYAE